MAAPIPGWPLTVGPVFKEQAGVDLRDAQAPETHRPDDDFIPHIVEFGRRVTTRATRFRPVVLSQRRSA